MKTIIALAIALFATTAGAEELESVKKLEHDIFIIANTYCNTTAANISDADARRTFTTNCMVQFATVSGIAKQAGRLVAIDQLLKVNAENAQ